MTTSIDFPNYISCKNSAISFTSNEYNLKTVVGGLAYQVVWEEGVRGKLKWQAAIAEGQWVDEIDCEIIELEINSGNAGSKIITLKEAWYLARYIRVVWTPSEFGTEGDYTVAMRVLPI